MQPVHVLAQSDGAVAVEAVSDQKDDGALAQQLGIPFALVLSGVTDAADVPKDPAPDAIAADLSELVHSVFDRT